MPKVLTIDFRKSLAREQVTRDLAREQVTRDLAREQVTRDLAREQVTRDLRGACFASRVTCSLIKVTCYSLSR